MKFNAISTIGATTVLAASIASVFAGAEAAPKIETANPLRVGMLALGDGNVEVTVTNTSRKTARIPRWQLPSAVAESNLFAITHDGEEVRYEGRMIKRITPTAADFAILRPGQSHRVTLNLAEAYDLSRTGDYTVTFAAPLQFASLSGGAQLKQLGAAAREQIEQLMDAKVFLELWVKVEPNWRRDPQLLRMFGYSASN